MKYTKLDDKSILLVLESGDLISKSLTNFCKKLRITSASFQGIGAVKQVELCYYDIDQLKYLVKAFNGNYELMSLTGNVASLDDQPIIHSHVVLSDSNFKTFGGHLKEAIVTVTCEITINLHDNNIIRIYNPKSDLSLIRLENEQKRSL